MARVKGSPRQAINRRRRTREGPELACVQTPSFEGGAAGEEEWFNILPWYRLVGVAIPPVSREGGRAGLPKKGKRPPRGTGTVLTYPGSAPRQQARLVKTVNIQVKCGSSPWTRPSAPGCGDTLKALAGDQRPIAHSSSYPERNIDKTWSSQEWKSYELMDVCPQGGAHQFVIEDDETESELSLGSRSFLHRVNDQVRKRQKQSSTDATEDSEEHSVMSCLQHSSTLQASVFMEKNTQKFYVPSKIQGTISRWNRCSTYLKNCYPNNQMRSMEWKTINWENSSWKYSSLIGDEQVISLQSTKVYVFSDSVLFLGKLNENPRWNIAWEERLAWFKSSPEYRTLDRIDGEPMEFEWNIFPGFTTLQLSHKVQALLLRLSETPDNFYRTDYLHVDVQRHLMGIRRQHERMRIKCPTRFAIF